MGATCGVIKKDKHISISRVLITSRIATKTPVNTLRHGGSTQVGRGTVDSDNQLQESTLDCRVVRLGYYFMEDELDFCIISKRDKIKSKKRLSKWHKMANYNIKKRKSTSLSSPTIAENNEESPKILGETIEDVELGLQNYLKDYPKKFHNRLCKGPPSQYRWLAWKIMTKMKKQIIKGLYEEELLIRGTNNEWLHSIEKDLNRTFPAHPYFANDQYGKYGQNALRNVLKAYSLYNTKVGYCQGMNFIIGFLLLMSGGNEEETFWLFCALTKTNFNDTPKFDGLEGLYQEEFPLLHLFMFQFEEIFKEKLPDLKQHFEKLYLPNAIWLQKWFISLFLYSFPFNLCIRIWDNLIVQGMSYLFKVSIAILKFVEKDLLEASIEGINEYFKNFVLGCGEGHILPDPEIIIRRANRIKISEKYLLDLKEKYYNTSGKTASHTVRSIPSRQPNTIKGAQSTSPEIVQSEKDNINNEVKIEDLQSSDSDDEFSSKYSKKDDILRAPSDTTSHVNSQDVFHQKFESHIVTYNNNGIKTKKKEINTANKVPVLKNDLFGVKHSADFMEKNNDKEELKLPPINQSRNHTVFSTPRTSSKNVIFEKEGHESSRYSHNIQVPQLMMLSGRSMDQKIIENISKSGEFGRPPSTEFLKNMNISLKLGSKTTSSTFKTRDSVSTAANTKSSNKRFGNLSFGTKTMNSPTYSPNNGTPSNGTPNNGSPIRFSTLNNAGKKNSKFTSNGTLAFDREGDEIEERIEEGEEDDDEIHESDRNNFRIEDIDDMISEDQGDYGSTWLRADSDFHADSILKLGNNSQYVMMPGLLTSTNGFVNMKRSYDGVPEINSSNVLSFVQKLPI